MCKDRSSGGFWRSQKNIFRSSDCTGWLMILNKNEKFPSFIPFHLHIRFGYNSWRGKCRDHTFYLCTTTVVQIPSESSMTEVSEKKMKQLILRSVWRLNIKESRSRRAANASSFRSHRSSRSYTLWQYSKGTRCFSKCCYARLKKCDFVVVNLRVTGRTKHCQVHYTHLCFFFQIFHFKCKNRGSAL